MILVGELNPYGEWRQYALYPHPPGSTGARLHEILGLSLREYLGATRYNLCQGKWSAEKAWERANEIVLSRPSGQWIVMLGRKVADAFGSDVDFFCTDSNLRFASLPHPSGRCCKWDEPDSVERARSIIHMILASEASS